MAQPDTDARRRVLTLPGSVAIAGMNVTILDDYVGVVPTLNAYSKLAGHNVKVWHDCVRDADTLAERLRETEALVLLRERSPIRRPLIERLPRLKMITLNGPHPHVDVDARSEEHTS